MFLISKKIAVKHLLSLSLRCNMAKHRDFLKQFFDKKTMIISEKSSTAKEKNPTRSCET